MTQIKDQNNPGIREGDRFGNYQIIRAAYVEAINIFYYELEHAVTGARHVHISNDDRENTFAVAFKTVPTDSTGVAHILEHTALCGSRKFPVRDPFFSMIKRSLNTFMNAFTASDWTMYPFSTQNRKDYYNLMDVYLDAAFFPNLDRLNFRQEGHRLEMEGDRPVFKGVVYNEMKGAMSSPDQVMVRSLLNALYPDTTYGHNSGGEPSEIPSLTHEQLVQFHRRHYHPSNAFFYTYGNLPLEEHLRFIQEKSLDHFQRIDPDTEVPSQPRWSEPKEMAYPYPFDAEEDPAKKYQACVAWLLADIRDTFEVLALHLLGEVLLGNVASPLRKALIESGLGSALSDGTGFDSDNRDTMFAAGLKDIEEASVPRVEQIVMDVLTELERDGIDKSLIEAAIHQLEFHRKEVSNTPYPYGLKLLMSFAGSWFHDVPPIRILEFDEDLKRIREEAEKGRFFEARIRKYFLDNPHRVRFTLAPDQQLARQKEEEEKARLERIKNSLSDTDIDRIRQDAEALNRLQETPEDLSVLPTLALSDIQPFLNTVDASKPYGALPATWYEQPTAGIFYFTAVAGLGKLPSRLLPLVPFFCNAFTKIGTARRDYTDMARLLDLYTGGMGLSPHARTRFDGPGDCTPFVTFSGKCLERNESRLFEIVDEFLTDFNFADLNRLRNLLLEYRSSLESMVVRSGHSFAISLSARHFSTTRYLNEMWSGIHHLRAIKEITEDLSDERLRELSADLVDIGKQIFTQRNLKLALVGEDSALTAAVTPLENILRKLPEGETDAYGPPDISLGDELPKEGWSTTTAVSFVARTFRTVRMEHPDAPALAVISKMLRSLYIHREIRERGGAYGGYAMYNREDGLFGFASYRDPHIVNTLNVYTSAAEFIRSGQYADEDIKEAILQVCSEIDRPDPPGPAARKAFYRQLIGLSDEARNQFKSRLLSLDREQVLDVAGRYFIIEPEQMAEAVISSADHLQQANEKLDRPLAIHRI